MKLPHSTDCLCDACKGDDNMAEVDVKIKSAWGRLYMPVEVFKIGGLWSVRAVQWDGKSATETSMKVWDWNSLPNVEDKE